MAGLKKELIELFMEKSGAQKARAGECSRLEHSAWQDIRAERYSKGLPESVLLAQFCVTSWSWQGQKGSRRSGLSVIRCC